MVCRRATTGATSTTASACTTRERGARSLADPTRDGRLSGRRHGRDRAVKLADAPAAGVFDGENRRPHRRALLGPALLGPTLHHDDLAERAEAQCAETHGVGGVVKRAHAGPPPAHRPGLGRYRGKEGDETAGAPAFTAGADEHRRLVEESDQAVGVPVV